jgi:hypothetical protein
MDNKNTRKSVASMLITVMTGIIAIVLLAFCTPMFYSDSDDITAMTMETTATSRTTETTTTTGTTTTKYSTSTTTSTTTTTTTSTSTSTSTTTTSTAVETTTTVVQTEEPVVETEPTVVEEETPTTPSEPATYDTYMIGGSGTVTVSGYTFNTPVDAQWLYDKCAYYGISPNTMYGVMMAESTMGTACSNLCGITSCAATSYNNSTGNGYYNWASDPYQNIEISLFCLAGAYRYYGNGSTYDALAGYNMGYAGHAAGSYSWYADTVTSYANSAC